MDCKATIRVVAEQLYDAVAGARGTQYSIPSFRLTRTVSERTGASRHAVSRVMALLAEMHLVARHVYRGKTRYVVTSSSELWQIAHASDKQGFVEWLCKKLAPRVRDWAIP